MLATSQLLSSHLWLMATYRTMQRTFPVWQSWSVRMVETENWWSWLMGKRFMFY